MDKLPISDLKYKLIAHRTTLVFVLVIVILVLAGFFAAQKFIFKSQVSQVGPEVDISFDPEGPYALLFPRRDGNALVLNLKRTASYDGISYELAYNAEGIDRGVIGAIDTKGKKGEYEQEILFGTCSKNVCKYDTGVENGTLTLHIVRASSGGKKKAYRMITQWHLQKPDVALGVLTSGDSHFKLKVTGTPEELGRISYCIINDLTGVPKLPDGKQVFGKVYALNVPLAKDVGGGELSLELADNAPEGAKLTRFDSSRSQWVQYDTKVSGSKLSAKSDGIGIFAVLTPKK